MSITIRPCEERDVPAVSRIHRHYVENTVITFALVPSTEEEIIQKLQNLNQTGLPFMVAEDNINKKVLGFCYAAPFRGSKGGYLHAAELSLFVDITHHSQGLGTKLLNTLIVVLTNPEQHVAYFPNGVQGARRVATLVVCMSVGVKGRDGGFGLTSYYERFGFTFVGQMVRVGFKFDRWYVEYDIGFAATDMIGLILSICNCCCPLD
jgi:L-amino acid N-acyltransferase YncA